MAIYNLQGEVSADVNHAGTFSVDIQPPETVDFCSWSHLVCGTLLWEPKQINIGIFVKW